MDNGSIEQLIYKKYKINGTINENKRYKQQLLQNLRCPERELKDFEHLEYERASLIDLFKKYNTCENAESTVFKKNIKREEWFKLSLRPGISFSSLSITNFEEGEIDFGQKTGFRFGLEAEFILPFNNNKWALFIEPTYHSYTAKQERNTMILGQKETYLVSAEYSSIELPIGGRHYFFLSQDAAIFINAALIIDVMLPSKIEFGRRFDDLEITPDLGYALGAGFKYKNRYSMEIRLQPSRQILKYSRWDSSYNSLSVIFGINIF